MPELSDRAAKDFVIALDAVRKKIVDEFIALKDTISAEELRQLIVTETRGFIFNDPKFSASFDKLIGVYGESLSSIQSFANVSEQTLQALIDVQRASWVAEAELQVNAIQKEIFNASLTGEWNQKTIMNNLRGLGSKSYRTLSEKQINAAVDNSLKTFERNVTTAMMDEMPEDTLYTYVGPLDDKTSEICNEIISAGPMTKQEIIDRFGSDVFENGGHFGCRHDFAVYTE